MAYLSKEEEIAIMKELEQFDTCTVTNAVATYSGDMNKCLGLYDPQETDWYTDNTCRCLYPDLGPRCGYCATVTYGMADPTFKRLSYKDVLVAISEKEGPVILCLKGNFSPAWQNRNAIIGGNMMTGFKQCGVVGAISDAPARDLEEMRPLEVQCCFAGLAPGHGTQTIQAVDTPVNICGMLTAPGEIIHMDVNGAVKFPRKYLKEVLENCKAHAAYDDKRQAHMKEYTDPIKVAEAMAGLYN